MIALGDKIQRLRVWRGLTQTDLAAGLVTPSMISQIEGNKANPSTELLLEIISRLGISVETFFKDVYLDLGGRAMYRFALDLVEHEQYTAALQFLQSLTERINIIDSQELQFQIAICLQNTGKIQEAIGMYDQVLANVQVGENKEFVSEIFYQLGEAYFQLHNPSLALFYGSKSFSIIEENIETTPYFRGKVNHLLGVASSRLGHFQKAIAYYEAAYKLYLPEYPSKAGRVLINLGVDNKNLEKYEEAEHYFKLAIKLFNSLPLEKNRILAKHNYAILLGKMNRFADALALFRECMDQFTEHKYTDMLPSVLHEIAEVELLQGNLESSKEYVKQGLENTSGDHYTVPYLKKVYAEIFYKEGNVEAAIQQLEESVPVYQKYGRVVDLVRMLPFLSKLYKEQGNVDKALSVLENSKMYIKNLM